MSKSSFNFFLLLLVVILTGWTIYSYSQIDLNLTLSANPVYQHFQNELIKLGYYQRPLSTSIFFLLLLAAFCLYFWLIHRLKDKIFTRRQIWLLILVSILLIFAYPAFSHDLYNYMFDARIVTKYHLSPALFRALDFTGDPWTRFMRWTHRYYPYGHGWLLISLVPSFLGLGKFVLTLGLFKLTFALFHLANCKLIEKITTRLSPTKVSMAMIFYAFNPLVLIESLVSPHNEVMMLTFVLLSIYLLVEKKSFWALLSLLFSGSIKFISWLLVPILVWYKGKVDQRLITIWFYVWLLGLLPVVSWREPFSWYVIPLVGIAALLLDQFLPQFLAVGLSLGTLLRYWPFLLWGEYNQITKMYQLWSLIIGFTVISLLAIFLWRKRRLFSS